ncbi:MAG: serine hydrolase, partial [Acidobacteria bacterium]|nr:serine hydrolase [Acidobacteriota bacterium]
ASGFFCDDTNPAAPGNEDAMLDQETQPDYWRFALDVPLVTAPGERSVYCSINPNLALGVLAHATGESPLVTFDRLLGRPMKIARYAWLLDPAGNPYGGGSAQFLPRDFLKFGQLMLDGGVWNGRRILDRAFVERASSRLTRIRNLDYGFLWWGIDLPYKSRTVHAFFAGGTGGQSVIVIPELSLAVATFGGNYSTPGTVTITHTLVPRFVLPAVREKGDDPHAPVVEREFTSPYGK